MNKHKFDAVVVGAGNGGLASAARMAKSGMKVLLVEQHNVPGGFASSFVRGRFEFEPALHELGAIGTKENQGIVYKLFDDLGANDLIDWCIINEAFTLAIEENGETKLYSFPYGREEFARKMDEYDKGSYKEVLRFIDLCYDLYECAGYLEFKRGKATIDEIRKNFPNYLSSGSYTLRQILDTFKLSKFAKNVLASYWVYLGTPPKELDFTVYAVMFAEYIKFGPAIPSDRSHEISSALVTKFQQFGGEVWFNTKVEKIDVVDKKIKNVVTSKGTIETEIVVSNCSPNIVYGELIDKKEVPEWDKKLVNFRKLNAQGYSFYIGLNIDAKKLNLTDYSYFCLSSLDHEQVFKNMGSIDTNNEYIVVVLNNGSKNASPEGTCILSFTTLYTDAWNDVNEENYFKVKEEIAYKMIKDFERKMNINIMDHIEEIEVATPITFARYTGVKNGVIYGYYVNKMNGSVVRGRNADRDINIDGLYFAGSYSFRGHGYSTTYKSGDIAGKKAFAKFKEKQNEKSL